MVILRKFKAKADANAQSTKIESELYAQVSKAKTVKQFERWLGQYREKVGKPLYHVGVPDGAFASGGQLTNKFGEHSWLLIDDDGARYDVERNGTVRRAISATCACHLQKLLMSSPAAIFSAKSRVGQAMQQELRRTLNDNDDRILGIKSIDAKHVRVGDKVVNVSKTYVNVGAVKKSKPTYECAIRISPCSSVELASSSTTATPHVRERTGFSTRLLACPSRKNHPLCQVPVCLRSWFFFDHLLISRSSRGKS